MKTLIHETPGACPDGGSYQVFAELTPFENYAHLKFTSCMSNDPESARNHFETFLNTTEAERLAKLLCAYNGDTL